MRARTARHRMNLTVDVVVLDLARLLELKVLGIRHALAIDGLHRIKVTRVFRASS